MHAPVVRSASLAIGALVLGLVGAAPAVSATGGHASRQPAGRAGEVGYWAVAPAGPGSFRLTWHSPTRIPTTDAAVQVRHDGVSATATVGRDARTASVVVSSAAPPDPSTYAVVLGTRVLDRPGTRVGGEVSGGTDRTPYRAPSVRSLLADPGEPGTHAVTSTDYQLAPVKLPDIKQLSEMVGHVVSPVDATNQSPLVLFLHGRHEACYGSETPQRAAAPAKVWSCPVGQKPIPSYLGYDYVQRLLASQGYVTVSISADAINALDYQAQDGGAAARAALIRDHLRAWVGFADSGAHPADLSDVVLVGHSRGGEGANRASLNLPQDEGYHVTGQVLIGPTDFGFQAAPSTPTVTLLPYCDGDVSDLQGQNFVDDARDITPDPATGLAFHSAVLVMGADHNFFNTEWTPGLSAAPSFDDWGGRAKRQCGSKNPGRLSAVQQQAVGKSYIAGAVHLFASGDQSALPMFDGSPVSVPSAGNADVRSHAIGGGLVTVRPGVDGTADVDSTAPTRLCLGVSDSDEATSCQKGLGSTRAPHWPSAFYPGVSLRQLLVVGWKSSGLQGGLTLDQPYDLSGDDRLDLRTIVDPRVGPVRVGVQLTDADGHSAVVTPVGGGSLSPLPSGGYSLAKRWGQDLRVPLAGVSGVDLTRVTKIGLVARSDTGRVFLVDLSATPGSGISTTPTAPLPLFSIDTVRQPEGNGTSEITVDVPWHVTGTLDHPAEVTVVHGTPFGTDDDSADDPLTEQVVIPAHTSSGVIHVTYLPNDLDDQGRRFESLTAYPVSGVETDRYLGGASIIDDDPTPGVSLTTDTRRIEAGERARWTLTLDSPVDYDLYALARPVRPASGPELRVGDLTKHFRERWFGSDVKLATPLSKSGLQLFVGVRQGRTSKALSVPTRPGLGVTRSLSLRFRVPHLDLAHPVRTVKVFPARR